MKKGFAVTGGLVAVAVIAALVFYFSHRNEPKAPATQAYADPKSCTRCHAPEAAGYATTGMAHAFYKPQAKDTVDIPVKRSPVLSMQHPERTTA